jgi:hypothetical protein
MGMEEMLARLRKEAKANREERKVKMRAIEAKDINLKEMREEIKSGQMEMKSTDGSPDSRNEA